MGEGCKLLEDQLRLMDEKYLDMRKKLDYARECQRQEMSRSQKEVSNLRKKFAMATGSSKLLDTYRLPSSNTPGPTSMDAAGRAVSWADFSDPSGMQGDSRVGTPQNRAKSAPMKRGKSASSPLIKANKHQEAISIDKVLNKIEKKRRELHGSCNTERAYELVAEFEEAQRPKTKGSKKNTREPDPVDMDYSVPIPMSLRQSEPEVLVVTEESICRSPMRSDSKTFSILGRSKH